MGQDPNFWAIIQVFLGGLLALLGVAAGPAVTQLMSDRSNQKAKRIDRFEALILAVYNHDHYLDQKANAAFHGKDFEGQPPIQTAILLCSLHFPELLPFVRKIEIATPPYIMWILGIRKKRLENSLIDGSDGLSVVYQPYLNAADEFRKEAAAFVQRNRKLF